MAGGAILGGGHVGVLYWCPASVVLDNFVLSGEEPDAMVFFCGSVILLSMLPNVMVSTMFGVKLLLAVE